MTSHEAKFLMRLSGSCYEIIFTNFFCKLCALYSCAYYGKAIVKSDADFVATSAQRSGSQEHWIGSDLSAICRLRSILHRKTSHNYGMYEIAMPGFVRKPFTMYNLIAILMLSPLGLNFFLAYQEFAFFSFSSIYKTFAKRVLETSEAEPKLIRTIQPSATAEEKNIFVYDAPREILHGHLKELVDLMKNMTSTFGPFLFQNFSFMLLYWLLHSYTLCFFVLQTIRNTGFLTNPTYLALICVQFAGNLLIVRWA